MPTGVHVENQKEQFKLIKLIGITRGIRIETVSDFAIPQNMGSLSTICTSLLDLNNAAAAAYYQQITLAIRFQSPRLSMSRSIKFFYK